MALTLADLGRVALARVFGLQVAAAINQIKGALEHGGDIGVTDDPRCAQASTRTGPAASSGSSASSCSRCSSGGRPQARAM